MTNIPDYHQTHSVWKPKESNASPILNEELLVSIPVVQAAVNAPVQRASPADSGGPGDCVAPLDTTIKDKPPDAHTVLPHFKRLLDWVLLTLYSLQIRWCGYIKPHVEFG